jgi:hypothetical protein
VNDTEFAILALSPQPEAARAAHRAAEWLIGEQNEDGSWPITCPRSACPEASGEVDATAAAVEALDAGQLEGDAVRAKAAAVTKALTYLSGAERAVREPSDPGGLPELTSEAEANVASTAWAAQALWSDGVSPETWPFAGGNPLTYMVSMQQHDGHIRYRSSSDANPVWMTAYVLPAFNGVQLPIVKVPRNPPAPASTAGAEPGHGGPTPAGSDTGVLAGGAGAGAPDFSRPRPRGRGHTRTRSDATADVTNDRVGPATSTPAGRADHATRARPVEVPRGRGGSSSSPDPGTVRGLLLAAQRTVQPDPPGLLAARAGRPSSSWLAGAIGFIALALATLGVYVERRQPPRAVARHLIATGAGARTSRVAP